VYTQIIDNKKTGYNTATTPSKIYEFNKKIYNLNFNSAVCHCLLQKVNEYGKLPSLYTTI
jgi:hypothetical protein